MVRNKERDTYLTNSSCNNCGSSDALGIYETVEGEKYGYCYSCETYDNSIEDKEFDETPKQAFNTNQGSFNDLKSRGISRDTCVYFGVKSIVNKQGIDLVHFYPHTRKGEIVSYCQRIVQGKKFSWSGDSKDLEFFNQKNCGEGGKMIIVTEGACDAMAVYEMLAKEGKAYRVVSVNNGAQAATRNFKENYDWIASFENIFLAFDQDEPGRLAALKIADMFPPNKVKIVRFSEKDPNGMLLSNKSKEFLSAIFSAKEAKPDGIVSVDDLFEEAIRPPVMGLSWPWPSLTEATLGYRRGTIIGVGAGSGCGKTEFFKEDINHTIEFHKNPAGIFFLEEPAAKTLKVLAGKKINKRLHIPQEKGGDWTIEELVDGINDLKDKVYLYNHFGGKDWSSIKSKMRYMVNALGIKDLYLDHLTALVAQEDNEYKALNRMMEELASLSQELDCTIKYISHLRKTSPPHEEGGHVSVDHFKGSGAISYWSNYLIGLERNQIAEDIVERNTTKITVLKDREYGFGTGCYFYALYDHKTGRWGEVGSNQFDDGDFS